MTQRTGIVAVLGAMALTGVMGPAQGLGQTTESARQNRVQREVTDEDRHNWRVADEGQARTLARQILGLDDKAPPRLSAGLVTLHEDNTPFLHDHLVGRPLWHVKVAQWRLNLPSATEDAQDRFARTFDVYIDPKNGCLLKLVSRWPEGVPPIAPEPAARSAEEQMSGAEKYHGFLESRPAVDFMRALDVVYKEGVGNPLVAKQIIAVCVERSAMNQKPRAVWAITLRGIGPLRAAYPGVPVDARNHIRNIVDASTGEWLCAGTSPQPQEPEESQRKAEPKPSTDHP